MWIFTKRRGIPFFEGADRFVFSAALGATLVRIGNLLNSEIVGKKTDGSWGFRFPRFDHDAVEAPLRHPSQIYEVTLGLTLLGLLLLIDKKLGREKRPRGAMISSYFVIYFTGRFFIEFFKEFEGISPDSPLRMGQILSLPGILLGIFGLYVTFKQRVPAHWPGAELPHDDEAADDDDPSEDEDEDEDETEDEDAADEEQKPPTDDKHDADIESEFDPEGRLKRHPGKPD